MSGALQPRVGWLVANRTFTACPACRYAPGAQPSVFVPGAVLAAIRTYWSTSLAIAKWILYDLVSIRGIACAGHPSR